MKAFLGREVIAMRAAKELKDGQVVNVGTGIPSLVPNYIQPDITIVPHSEIGATNFGRLLTQEEAHLIDTDYVVAGGQFYRPTPGLCIMDHCTSFIVVRGGRLDVSLLGALEVSEEGDLASIPYFGEKMFSIGGAMDIAYGAKKLIVCMTHITRDGNPKIVKECHQPLTAKKCVDIIVTDAAVINVVEEGLLLREVAPGWTAADVQEITEPRLIFSEDLKEMEL